MAKPEEGTQPIVAKGGVGDGWGDWQEAEGAGAMVLSCVVTLCPPVSRPRDYTVQTGTVLCKFLRNRSVKETPMEPKT